MSIAIYTAAQGARAQQERLDTIGNNIANVNTYGYKTKQSVFYELLHHNMKEPEEADSLLTAGAGVAMSHTNTNFSQSGIMPASTYDYAIEGEGFFMIQDPVSQEITYTRAGNFQLSLRADGFYLVNDSRKSVLDAEGNPIIATYNDTTGETSLSSVPGIYTFNNTDGMLSVGGSEFSPLPKNGPPILNPEARLIQGHLELSNVDTAFEFTEMIEASRSYAYVLKMVQTSDEVFQTINSLRN